MNWTTIEAIFNAATMLPLTERAAYLAQACGADDALRAEVEKLLRSHDEANSFLEKPLVGADAATQPGIADVDTEPLRIGPYQIVRELGRGGMGAVYLAERADGEFKQRVAIKLMRRAGSAWEIARFKQERQILADLDHPNIARLLDGGTHEGMPYVVMECVEGESLRALLKRRGALPLDLVVTLTRQLSAGLSAAHERGIVHRDIKPENLMVAEKSGQWRLKILDFGIARAGESNAASGDERNHTRTGLVLGTATYMSPEQARGATGNQIDARSDVYSQGCVLYEMLTGQAAFTGDSFNDVVAKHLYEPPPPFNTLPNIRASAATVISPMTVINTTIDESLPSSAIETVVRKALAKDRKDRQQSVLELADELETAARQPINDPLRTTPLPQPVKVAATNKLAAPRRWLPWAGAALIVVSLLGWGARQWLMKTAPAIETKQPVLPTTLAATLTYRAFRRDTGKAIHPLGLNDQIVIEDDIYLELTSPVSCAVYFFYEDRNGTLIWANPLTNETPQRALAGQTLRVPTKDGVSMGETERVQSFLVVYVPTGVNWSLEDAVNPEPLKIETKGVYIPYVQIGVKATERLKKYLDSSATLISFAAPQDTLYSQSLAQTEPRAFYHRLELYQRPPR